MAAMDEEAAREWAEHLKVMPAAGVRALVAELQTPGMPRLRVGPGENLRTRTNARGGPRDVVAARWTLFPFWAAAGFTTDANCNELWWSIMAASVVRWAACRKDYLPHAVGRYAAAHSLDEVAADLLERTEAWLRGEGEGR